MLKTGFVKFLYILLCVLSFSACAAEPSKCVLPNEVGYDVFVPSKEDKLQILKKSSSFTKEKINHSDIVVWARNGENDLVACVPNNLFSQQGCGQVIYFFQRIDGQWLEERSEITQCHKLEK